MNGELILPAAGDAGAGITRVAYVTTANTGKVMTIRTFNGDIRLDRHDPHGVVLSVLRSEFAITKDALPFIGRFFLAAGLSLGVDINDGWDVLQEGGAVR